MKASLITVDTQQVYKSVAGARVAVGLKVTSWEDSGEQKPVVAIQHEWLVTGAVRLLADQHCSAFHSEGSEEDFRQAAAVARVEGVNQPEGPVAYLVPDQPFSDFTLEVNGDHPDVLALEDGPHTLSFRYALLDPETSEWEEMVNPLYAELEIKGEPGVFRGVFAIDVGTTSTCAAFMEGTSRIKLFEFEGEPEIPTVVAYDRVAGEGEESAERHLVIGKTAAIRDVEGDVRRIVRGVKRYLGLKRSQRLCEVVDLRGRREKLPAEVIYTDFLNRYLGDFTRQKHWRLTRIKATYPPDCRGTTHQIMRDTFERMGVETGQLLGVDEASAAALYYVFRRLETVGFDVPTYQGQYGDPHSMLVFDLGGGTTDVALVRVGVNRVEEGGSIRHELVFKVLNAASELHIGGDNFTLELMKAIRFRLALAAAHLHEGQHPEPQNAPAAAKAMRDLFEHQREEFQDLLPGRTPKFGKARRAQVDGTIQEMDELANLILPTAWDRLPEGARVWDKVAAMNTFHVLWKAAEEVKKELSDSQVVKLDPRRYQGGEAYDAIKALELPADTIGTIAIDREVDLYPRINDMLKRTVRLCRQVVGSSTESRVDSVQLVGNSCKMPRVREMILQELKEIPDLDDIIEHEPVDAKTAVARGACLAFYIQGNRGLPQLSIRVEGLDDQLRWFVGDYQKLTQQRSVYFGPEAKPGETEPVYLRAGPQTEFRLYRWRPGFEDAMPEVLGLFDLTKKPKKIANEEPLPADKWKLVLLGPTDFQLVTNDGVYPFRMRKGLIKESSDPFSGIH